MFRAFLLRNISGCGKEGAKYPGSQNRTGGSKIRVGSAEKGVVIEINV